MLIGPAGFNPLPFTFGSDLHIMFMNCEAVIYADNTTLLYVHHNVYHSLEALQWELITLMQCFYATKLSLNLTKTEEMIFHFRGIILPKFPKLLVQNNKIDSLSSFKHLGVIFIEKLNSTKHINYTYNKLISNRSLLNSVKNILT